MLVILLLVIGGLYLLILGAAVLGGRTIAQQLVATYGGPHEVREVLLDDVPEVPANVYERVRSELLPLGFRSAGVVEDLTISRAHPNLRTCIEAFVHPQHAVYAASFQARDPQAPQQVVDLETWFDDGTFLITTNGRMVGMLESAPAILRNKVAVETPLQSLWESHEAALAEFQARTGARPRPIDDLAGILEAQQAFTLEEIRHRRQLGYLTSEELRRLAAGLSFLPGVLPALEWALRRRLASLAGNGGVG